MLHPTVIKNETKSQNIQSYDVLEVPYTPKRVQGLL